jgi:CheY-like chemotaxis protein
MRARNSGASGQGETARRVLIIDDDASVRDSLRKVLEEAGYGVVTAEDGQEGADQLRAGPFDLLVLDLNLPVLSGWDVLDLVKTELPSLPLVILTGELHQCERGGFAGTDVVLEKPCDADLLLRTMEELLTAPAKTGSRRGYDALAGGSRLEGVAAQDAARLRKLSGSHSV